MRRPVMIAVFSLAAVLAPSAMEAQVGPNSQARPSISIGARAGYDFEISNGAFVLGAGTRISIPGMPYLELQGVTDWTFLDGLTERQMGVDLLYQFGGLAVGGGPVVRNTIWDAAVLDERESRTGYSLVVILAGQATNRLLNGQLELRYTKVSNFTPKAVSVGVNLPLVRFRR